MSIVEIKNYGDTTVRFSNDCCKNVEKQDIEKMLKTISQKTITYLQTKTT